MTASRSALRAAGVLCVLLAVAAPLRAAPGSKDVVRVTGRFLYEDKAWNAGGWTGSRPERPVRRADVTVLDAATDRVLGRGSTDGSGGFDVEVAAPLPVTLLARVDSDSRVHAKAVKAMPRILVQSNQKVRYSAFSPAVAVPQGASEIDLGTTVVHKTVVGTREGNPFNVFDMAVAAFEVVTGPEIGVTKKGRSVRLHWPNLAGSYAQGRRAWISDDDGYDDAVILHEVGHLVHNVYSDSDNPGGVHYFGDSDQDPRLSFGEGFATAFGGAVLAALGEPALYMDASGSAQAGGAQLVLHVETSDPYFDAAAGAADEVAVACVLYDLLDGHFGAEDGGSDDDGFVSTLLVDEQLAPRAFWKVFTGPVRRAKNLTMNHAWDGWLKLHRNDPKFDELQHVYEAHLLLNWPDAAEPDDEPEQATLLAVTDGSEWVTGRTLYRSKANKLGPGTGDRDWYAVELQAGAHVVIETRYPGNAWDAGTQADPFLVLFDPQGRRVAKDDDSGVGRNAAIAFVVEQDGVHTFMVRSKNPRNRYGRYEVQVRQASF